MTDQVEKMAPQILAEIKKAKSILLHCHPSPDPDSVGGALALAAVLKQLDKDVTIISGDSSKKDEFDYLPGYSEIIEENFFTIDLSKFDLFIICDSADISMVSSLNPVSFPKSLKTIAIDHHHGNPGYGDINLIESFYPANCQLLYDLFKIWNIQITLEIAFCLYMGIYSDTGGFKYSGTKPETLQSASELLKVNPECWRGIFEMLNNNEPDFLRYKGLALSNIKTYFSGRVAITITTLNQIKKNNIKPEFVSASLISNELISVKGWEIGIVGTEKEKNEGESSSTNKFRFSFRVRNEGTYDVSKIAEATGKGGGHKSAAGAAIDKPLKEALDVLLKSIEKIHPELGKP